MAFKMRGFEEFHPARINLEAQRGRPTPSRAKPASLLVSGNSLVIGHGKCDEVQRCAQNERWIRRAPMMCNRAGIPE
jgi:hypothetical protein